jgi:hypothetical protein
MGVFLYKSEQKMGLVDWANRSGDESERATFGYDDLCNQLDTD